MPLAGPFLRARRRQFRPHVAPRRIWHMRTTLDLSPLFRSTIGFDRMSRLLDAASRLDESAVSYPPYNIEVLGEDAYRITMAVAGFGESDISITAQENSLVITGKLSKSDEDRKFLHRGIAGRAFERRFELADHIRVSGASRVTARPLPSGRNSSSIGP